VSRPTTILIAEDDPLLRKVTQRALELEGYHVLSAPDGRQALDLTAHELFDLLIVDGMMPELDGFQVAYRVRATSQVPILFVTARVEEGERRRAFAAGASDYLPKPFSAAELAARVAALLRPPSSGP
jgi:two-component system, OmpR family, response regulator